MTTYEELLSFGKDRIDDFFKNVQLFPGQFTFSDFNKECYKKMYEDNSTNKTVKELKQEIPELTPICKQCGSYYINPRNKSKMIYDLMQGQLFENILIDFINSKYHLKVAHADKTNKRYPDCMVLSSDKQIVAYFEVKYHSAPFISAINKINRYCYEGSITLDYKKLVKQLEIIDSDLDRPVFYLHWVDFPCLKGVFFETSEQVKQTLYEDGGFERKERDGDLDKNPQSVYLYKFYSHLLEMGNFDEFIKVLQKLSKGE